MYKFLLLKLGLRAEKKRPLPRTFGISGLAPALSGVNVRFTLALVRPAGPHRRSPGSEHGTASPLRGGVPATSAAVTGAPRRLLRLLTAACGASGCGICYEASSISASGQRRMHPASGREKLLT
ncbi:jg22978 [Pararge aegeria aegeria]|uniref:Jg22978 protein n=1 Tax=Pararge aegeria aegeria TaxID=348720 RepID=A0A8S4QAR0_9NEOP|nr:jg22978 [Pararge aegeria aegeria]